MPRFIITSFQEGPCILTRSAFFRAAVSAEPGEPEYLFTWGVRGPVEEDMFSNRDEALAAFQRWREYFGHGPNTVLARNARLWDMHTNTAAPLPRE